MAGAARGNRSGMASPHARPDAGERPAARSFAASALFGVGAMAAVDTVVFHQLLGWHHFYDRSTSDVGLASDGLLQAAYLVALVAGAFMAADLRRRGALDGGHAAAGLLVGLGGFQLFDGTVNHKVLGLHEIRYGVENLWAYDLAWIGAACALIAAGLAVLAAVRRRAGAAPGG